MIPKSVCCFLCPRLPHRLTDESIHQLSMFLIEALHPDGWRQQGRARLEYWACQEAQMRCCSDGRNYRIVDESNGRIVALLDSSSCRIPADREANKAPV